MRLPADEIRGVRVRVGARTLVSFAGCDYLGLARDDEVVAAARAALARFGVGASASRTTTGTARPHVELERELAAFMGDEDAVALPSGWLASQALALALAPRADVALLDAGAHPALRHAATLCGLPVRTYARFDARAASRAAAGGVPLVLTDSADLATGALAPLRALASLAARSGGELVVDDAHGVGVLGATGRGAAERLSAQGPRVHVAGSLSKAFGTHGGFVTGTRELCRAVRRRAAPYAGATPVPPAIAAASAAAVRLAAVGRAGRRLRRRTALLRSRFLALGLRAPAPGIPWFAISGGTARELRALAAALARAGFLVPYLRYHGAPPEGYLKIAVSAAHRRRHVDGLADALRGLAPPRRG